MTVLRTLFALALLVPASLLFSQTDHGFSYQAIARDPGGNPMANQSFSLKFLIRSGSSTGPVLYEESHSPTTSGNGLFTAVIGEGNPLVGSWSQIDWSSGNLFLEVKIDGNVVSAERLQAVPFAKAATNMAAADLTDVSDSAPQTDQVLKWNGSTWAPANDEEGISYSAGTGISIAGGLISNASPDQPVTLTGSGATSISGSYPSFTISSTDLVNDADADPTNEIQSLSISGTDLTLSNGGGSVVIPQKTYTGGPGITVTGTVINNSGDTDASDDITTSTTAGGDLAGNYPNPWVNKLKGVTVSGTAPAANQVLTYIGNSWQPANPPQSPWSKNGSNVSYTGGNVGIGITTPGDKLHIHENSTASSAIRLSNSLTGISSFDGFWLGYSATNAAYVFNHEASPIIFGTSNAERLRITANGQIGIGTLNPSAIFEIFYDGSPGSPQLGLREAGTADYSRIRFQNASGSTSWYLSGKTASPNTSAVFELTHSALGSFITATGQKRIGLLTDNPGGDLHLKQTSSFWADGGGLILEENGSSTDNWQMLHTGLHFSFVENGTRRSYIEAGTGNWVQPSDSRLKSGVEPIPAVLERLQRITPVSYQYTDPSAETRTIGFLAQEVVGVFPELVHESEDGYLGLAYRDFGILAVKAIQEQQQLIEEQEARIGELESRLARQERLLQELMEKMAE